MISYNINHYVYVKLTSKGEEILRSQQGWEYRKRNGDLVEFQLWELMNLYMDSLPHSPFQNEKLYFVPKHLNYEQNHIIPKKLQDSIVESNNYLYSLDVHFPVMVKLTDQGKEILSNYLTDQNEIEEKHGVSVIPIADLFWLYGEHLYNGTLTQPFDKNRIYFLPHFLKKEEKLVLSEGSSVI